MWFSLLAVALAQEPAPPSPAPEEVEAADASDVDETLTIWGDPAVARARDALTQALREEGYSRRVRRDDRTVFKSDSPWKPRVIVHDDGWVYLKREPPRVHAPGRSFSDQGSPAAYLLCVIMPTACVSVGGWLVSDKKLDAAAGEVLFETQDEVRALNQAVARHNLARRLNDDIPKDLERIWALPDEPAMRRRLLFEYWDSRAEGPAGDQAKDAIESFIRGVVQASADPFSAEEIEAFNQIRSGERPFLQPKAVGD